MGEMESVSMQELTEQEAQLRRDGLRILARLIARCHLARQQQSRVASSKLDHSNEPSAPKRPTETSRR